MFICGRISRLASWRGKVIGLNRKMLRNWSKTLRWRWFREWFVVIFVALLAAFIIRATFVQTYFIPSESMTPTLAVGDRLMVYKLAFSLGDVDRGDLVVFNRPANMGETDIKDFVKRVIGLEGEQVTAEGGAIYVDGRLLDEPYLTPDTYTSDFPDTAIPPDHVFVLGDNRPNSRDSRFFGPIHKDLLVGEVFLRIWPLDGIGRP
jgi:signal peptidase I